MYLSAIHEDPLLKVIHTFLFYIGRPGSFNSGVKPDMHSIRPKRIRYLLLTLARVYIEIFVDYQDFDNTAGSIRIQIGMQLGPVPRMES